MALVLPRSRADLRRTAAVAAGKGSALATRVLRRGGGTALPGLVASRLDPGIVRKLALQLCGGTVAVSGTNGKTTTSRMLGAILTEAGQVPLRNGAGSNLMRGLASALVERASFAGTLPRDEKMVGLFEVDEAALPEMLSEVRPRAVLLLDLFRDQLDRYGEVATVARIWARALAALPAATCVIANADDPLVTDVAGSAAATTLTFGIESAERLAQGRDHASDVKACPRCGGRIEYDVVFLGHLGHYRCLQCDLSRPRPDVRASDVRLAGVSGSSFRLHAPEGDAAVDLPLPGLYNVYNALGAAATAVSLGLGLAPIVNGLQGITAAFGRMERIEVDGRAVYLALAKNPAGLNEVLRTLLADPRPAHLMMMLNDNIADGRDVSWIWDADVEMLAGHVSSAVFAGTRAEDMALRFKYAGVTSPESNVTWEIDRNTESALHRSCALTPPGRDLFVVPTYTALLDVRNTMTRLGYVRPYWEE